MSDNKDEFFFHLCSKLVEKIFSLPDFAGTFIPRAPRSGYFKFLSLLDELLEKDEDYENIINYMNESEVYSKHFNKITGISHSYTKRTCWEYIFFLIREQIYFNKGKFILNKEKLLKDYKILEDFFHNDKVIMRAWLRLINFKLEGIEEIDLGNDIKIKKMGKQNIRLLMDQNYIHLHSMFIIEVLYEKDKVFIEIDDMDEIGKIIGARALAYRDFNIKIQNSLYHVLNFLRIFKEGDIKAGALYRTPLHNIFAESLSSPSSMSSKAIFINTYLISASELDEFKSGWDEYKKLDITKYKEFSSSLRRLGYAMERDRDDDRLVDLVIAVESLFYKSNGGRTELTYRIRLRLSKLLEENIDERKDIAIKMNKIYRERGRIIHGDEYRITRELVKDCEILLRKALTKYLVLRKELSHDSLIDKLDYA